MGFPLAFLVNPIAGMGGRVGLKGTDGLVDEAIRLGAKPVAPDRGVIFLKRFHELMPKVGVLVAPKVMGEFEARRAGVAFNVLDYRIGEVTSAEDTKNCVRLFLDSNVKLIVFVGGDGTARDVLDAVGDNRIAVLGVPAGVKMFSGVFAANPFDAAEIASAYLRGDAEAILMEVLDVDESAYRSNRLDIRLYGYMLTPVIGGLMPGSKQPTRLLDDELENQRAIARTVLEEINRDDLLILGPGTTVKALADLLGFEKTLLGVDVYWSGRVFRDVNEAEILGLLDECDIAWIVVSPIGRQGIIFGRGNQQISPRVIERVGKNHIIVVATHSKLASIGDKPLRVDTGDPRVDSMLRGYIRVLVDYNMWIVKRVL